MPRQERQALISQLEERRGSKVLCILTSDRMNAQGIFAKDFIPIAYNHLRAFGSFNRLDIFLFTLGGDTQAAFGFGRAVRELGANKVAVLVPEKCHSAGTLFALGADQIVMTAVATLSPIDPSVTTPLNPQVDVAPGQRQSVPVSVESVAGYRDLVQKEWKLDEQGTAAAFRVLAEKVNPLALGDVYRSREQIALLARKLLTLHRHDDSGITKITESLTRTLGSHDYLISRAEAQEIFGKEQIPDPRPEEIGLIWDLFSDFAVEMKLGQNFDALSILNNAVANNINTPVRDSQQIVKIESLDRSDVWERDLLLRFITLAPGQPEQVQILPLYNDWRRES
jgi:serine dehydrogenase proteinase